MMPGRFHQPVTLFLHPADCEMPPFGSALVKSVSFSHQLQLHLRPIPALRNSNLASHNPNRERPDALAKLNDRTLQLLPIRDQRQRRSEINFRNCADLPHDLPRISDQNKNRLIPSLLRKLDDPIQIFRNPLLIRIPKKEKPAANSGSDQKNENQISFFHKKIRRADEPADTPLLNDRSKHACKSVCWKDPNARAAPAQAEAPHRCSADASHT